MIDTWPIQGGHQRLAPPLHDVTERPGDALAVRSIGESFRRSETRSGESATNSGAGPAVWAGWDRASNLPRAMKSRLQAVRSRWVIGVLIVALLYYGGASLGLRLAFEKTNASPVWPSSGIALAAVLLLGYRIWPGIAVGAFLANVVGFLAHQAASALTVVVVSLTIGVGNTVEAIAGAFLLHRLVGTRNRFYRAQDGFRFTAVALLACCVSPSIGSTSVSLAGIAPPAVYGTIWFTWWLGDAIGMLLVTPLLLTWGDEPQVRWSVRGHVEAGVPFASFVFAGWVGVRGPVGGAESQYPLSTAARSWGRWAAVPFCRPAAG